MTSDIIPMSGIILAGGKSQRMGTDKAFLNHDGHTFISQISVRLLGISDDIVIAIGNKARSRFEEELAGRRVRIINDNPYIDNPLGGVLSALRFVKHDYAFVIACDSPMLEPSLVRYLYRAARSHSAAVPVWEEHDTMTSEPLIAVYNVEETKIALSNAINTELMRCKRLLSLLRNVNYVNVNDLRRFDPNLSSLCNINRKADYFQLEAPSTSLPIVECHS